MNKLHKNRIFSVLGMSNSLNNFAAKIGPKIAFFGAENRVFELKNIPVKWQKTGVNPLLFLHFILQFFL